jgi:hypothetical protein
MSSSIPCGHGQEVEVCALGGKVVHHTVVHLQAVRLVSGRQLRDIPQ